MILLLVAATVTILKLHCWPWVCNYLRQSPCGNHFSGTIFFNKIMHNHNKEGLSFTKRGLRLFLVETGESRTPRPEEPAQSIYKLSRLFVLAPLLVRRPISAEPVDLVLSSPYRHQGRSTSTFRRPVPNPSRRGRGGRSCLIRQLGRILFRQLLFCHLFYE